MMKALHLLLEPMNQKYIRVVTGEKSTLPPEDFTGRIPMPLIDSMRDAGARQETIRVL